MRTPIVVAAFLLLVAGSVLAAGPTLKKVKQTGEFTIGFVPDAPPLSFADDTGAAAGYSVELCRRIAAAVKTELQLEDLKINYVPLTSPQARLDAIENGDIDIECGGSTITLGRRAQVDFTLMTLITGGAVLSKKSAPVETTSDLSGKIIAVIGGTTTETALATFLETNLFDAQVRTVANHEEGVMLLDQGKVDAYAGDQVMLIGQVLGSPERTLYTLTRDVFSFEPYAFMVRRDDAEFRLVADRALAQLYRTAAIKRLYHDWFGRAGIQPSPVLQAMYQFQGLPD